MPELRKKYPFDKIEPKWQRYWSEHKTFAAREDAAKKKLYILDMFPYPSGAGLHVGHPEGYTATDIYSRFQRMRGFNVLHPMGWDAFGLPAEQYAIDTGTHPAATTRNNVDTFRRQVQKLGFSYDWDREVDTTDPEYFKWTQWIFLQLFNSFFDPGEKRCRPIAVLEDALSEVPQREAEWSGSVYVVKLRDAFLREAKLKPQFGDEIRRAFITSRRLAYEAKAQVWWCGGCQAVLANEEVKEGKCDRKGHENVYRRFLRQWQLQITAYAERLSNNLDQVKWPESIKEQQRNWIGRSEGAEVIFLKADEPHRDLLIKVFTTRPDTLYGATYLVLAPEHPALSVVTTTDRRQAVEEYRLNATRKSELERTALEKDKTGEFTGSYAVNPVNGERIQIWVADYVLMSYGTGAIMAVPAHDQRDFEFAKKYQLPIRTVIVPSDSAQLEWRRTQQGAMSGAVLPNLGAWVTSFLHQKDGGKVIYAWDERTAFEYEGEAAELVSSENAELSLSGMRQPEAKKLITEFLERRERAKFTVNYKLRDWLFSRQRYWGEPIPIVHCPKHGTVPVPESELPLRLPEMKDYTPSGNAEPPLAKAIDWVNTKCPQCGGPAKRETNTMPQWAGSCWYYLRYIDPKNDGAFVGRDKEQYWMPVDLYVGGAEHAVLHLLYSRFWHKVLFDLGHVSTPEPFMRLVNQGMILGEDSQKMSKSRGNVIPIDVPVAEFGADTLRVFEMFMGPLDMVKPWNTRGAEGVYRFLGRVWRLFCDDDGKLILDDSAPSGPLLKVLHQTIKKVGEDTDALAFNTAIAQMMIFVNEVTAQERRPRKLLEPFVLLLAPYAPHLAEELWEKLGHNQSLAYAPWPKYDDALLKEDKVTVILQVNGKVRDRLEVPAQISSADLEQLALANMHVQQHIAGKQVKKVVVVPGKLVNIAAS